jgi:amino acid adenylation domain-containing protein
VLKTQREQVLEAFNARPSQAPALSLQEILRNTAVAQGDKTAVIFADQRQSYAELNQASARIAAALLAEGVGKGSYVAVCLERSLNVPAVLWGVLRTGAAYVALDPIFPLARIQTVLESAGAALLLADQSLLNDWPSLPCPALAVETALQAPAAAVNDVVATAADAPAYVVFTSGSTGKPKGVVLAQGGLVNCLSSLSRAPGLRTEETALAVATLAFDFSVYEIFLPLWVGATLVIADLETTTDGDRLKALIDQHRITSSHATPATMRLLQAAGWAGTPDFRMVFGGEPLPRDLVAWLLPRIAEIWNIYGPTETTITSNLCRVVSAEGTIPVGAPIEGVRCYVLNPAHEPLPVGVAGELYIGGAGVGLGYLNQPDLTAERFISNPFHGGMMYRSGDLARWLADGSIEILGRIDTQVKLRGYRMELGEIEHVLAQHPDVLEAVVSVRQRITANQGSDQGANQGKDDRLVAWLAVGASSVPASELRQWCREALPSYMVPQSFVLLDSLPRLLNGKIDHKSLPNPFADQAVIVAKIPPSTDNQRLIASLWAQVLGVPEDSIGVDDRFFDLGGHSLLAVQVAAQIQQKTGSKPVLRGVLMNPLSALADSLPVLEAVTVEAPAEAIQPAIQPAAPPAEAVLPVALPNAPTRAWWQRLLFRED